MVNLFCGRVGFILSLLGLGVFSALTFSSNNLFSFWLFFELAGLSLVPMFFVGVGPASSKGLFSYLITSGIASSFILVGVMFEDLLLFIILGMLIKFGVFPFFSWVYSVAENSDWGVIWGLSTFLKVPFFIFPFCLMGHGSGFVDACAGISFLFLSLLFWVHTGGWRSCWCHMLLSSSASLVVMACHQDLFFVGVFFAVYFVWASLAIRFLSLQHNIGLFTAGSSFSFFFLLLGFPLSLAMVYKVVLCSFMTACGWFVLVSWVVYTVSEQGYLWFIFFGGGTPRSHLGLSRLV